MAAALRSAGCSASCSAQDRGRLAPLLHRPRAACAAAPRAPSLLPACAAPRRHPSAPHVARSKNVARDVMDAIDAIDGAKRARAATLHKLYGDLSQETFEAVLDDDFAMSEMGHARRFTKSDYVGMMGLTLAAIPDFSWGAATTADVADDGYCVVVVTASGHHTGTDLRLPGREPLPPSGRHFCLAEEVHKVKVDSARGRVKEIIVLPNKGAGPSALYQALGGTAPAPKPPAAGGPAPPMP